MKYEKTDKSGLYRDTHSGAIVNRDINALNAYKKKKANYVNMKNKQNKIEKELDEIKGVLNQIIQKLNEK